MSPTIHKVVAIYVITESVKSDNEPARTTVRKRYIRRAVASSTAIETSQPVNQSTSQPVKVIEKLLNTGNSKFKHLKLAH